MALTKVNNDLLTLDAAQPTITSVGTLTNFTSTGIDDNATSTAITITSDENVGIGVSPSTTLDVYNGAGWGGVDIDGSAGGELRLQKSGTDYGGVYASDSHGLVIRAVNGVNSMQFLTNSVERMRIHNSGVVTMPSQPAFLVAANGSNAIAAAGHHKLTFMTTERFDNNGNYSNSEFTAPVTGRYQFSWFCRVDGLINTSAHTSIDLMTSNRHYVYSTIYDMRALDANPAYWNFNCSVLVDMDANDVAYLVSYIHTGTGVVNAISCFSGYLVA